MNKVLNDNRFLAMILYGTLAYVLIEYARENQRRMHAWMSAWKQSPRAAFARTQRERMVAAEFAEEDCGCTDGGD